MPNRIIRPGINSSPRVNALGMAEELFFRRLFAVADDYGIFELNFDSLLFELYPLKMHEVTIEDLETWWDACFSVNLVREYRAKGRVYGVILDFKQQARHSSDFPFPPADSGMVLCKSSNTAKTPLVGFQLSKEAKNPEISQDIQEEKKKEKKKQKEKEDLINIYSHTTRMRMELLPAVERIKFKHPRLSEPILTEAVIMRAILGKVEKGLTVDEAVKAIETATEMYAAITSKWPESEHKFIVSSRKWFERGCYDEPPLL